MSVELEMSGYCKGCHLADVDIQTWWHDGTSEPTAFCNNEPICEMWLKKIPQEKEGLTDGETEFITGNETFKKAFAAGWNACVKEMKKWEET